MNGKKIVFAVFIFLVSTSTHAQLGFDAFHYTINKKVICSRGAVVSAHPLASKAGVAMLKKGGNAFDAAIATQLALAVVYPQAGNLGGGGFLVGRIPSGKNISIDYREKAPSGASRDMYLDANGNPQMKLSQDGHLSSGVPGTIAGLFATHKYAKLPFKTLIQPAIELAEKGFAITAREAQSMNSIQNRLKENNTVACVFLKPAGWKAGDTLVQPELARTLKRIRDGGAKGFYEGETAQLIIDEMKRGKGILSLQDLKNYQAVERKATQFNYRGYEIVTMPLPSSGGIIIEQCLKIMASHRLNTMGFQSAQAVQLMVEAERRAFADRAEYMGDPDFVKVPAKTLVSDAYLADRMKDFVPGQAGNSQLVKAGKMPHESEETTHLAVVDEKGNAVAVTTTLNNSYGSATVVGGAGFFMNDEMDDFSVKPGVPNMYGALGTEANAIAPGKRMLSSMTPTLVLKNNRPFLVAGTPGGTTIPTSVFQTIVNVIDFNLSTEDAVNKPKFHHQWLPEEIMVEKDFPAETRAALEKMGYKIVNRGAIGRSELIRVDGKKIEAVGDNRGDDSAEGY